jgi:hypothetical protein
MRRRIALLAIAGCAAAAAQSDTVQFNRDIRPILSERCFTCHGPDEGKRKSKLRLDIETGAKGDLEVILPSFRESRPKAN